jgi:hypothetical protein
MKTRYRVIFADARPPEEREVEADFSGRKGLKIFHEILRPILGPDADFEHVRVYWPWDGGEPRYLDMFVDEDGIGKRLPVNKVATSIYHMNVIVHDPHGRGSEESIANAPRIHGTAVLFQKPVWS